MYTVYKYKISPENFSNISKVEMPHDAKILSVGSQNNEVFVWAEVNTESSVFIKMFETVHSFSSKNISTGFSNACKTVVNNYCRLVSKLRFHSISAVSDILSEAESLRSSLLSVLQKLLFGDQLTAEFLLCHIVSGV